MSPARPLLLLLALAGCVSAPPAAPAAPRVDHHQHLVSPAFAAVAKVPPLDGAALLARLDAAGVRRALVLSVAYSLADERKALADPDALVRAENDWTSAQVAASRGRLVGLCSVNPLRGAASAELARCLALPGMAGLKLHFGNSGVSLRDPAQLASVRAIVGQAGRAKATVLIHMRARGGANFGAPDARLLIDQLLPLLADSDLIVAHLGGAGPGYPDQADEVMAVFADAIAAGDRRLARTFFDLATVVTAQTTPADAALIARRIRQVGPGRILYGSDLGVPGAPTIAEGWGLVTTRLGLTPAELRTIARARLRFMR